VLSDQEIQTVTHSLDWEFELEPFLQEDFLYKETDTLHQYLLKCFSFRKRMCFSH